MKFDRHQLVRWEIGILLLVAVVLIVAAFVAPTVFGAYNIKSAAAASSVLICLAIGLTPCIMTGEIDISIGAEVALTGVIFGQMIVNGVDVWVAIVIALVLASLMGLLNGLLVVLLGLPSMSVTLGTLGAYTGAAFMLGGAYPVTSFPSGFALFGREAVGGATLSFWAALLLTGLMAVLIHGTTFGKSVLAAGGGKEAARFSGIPVARVKIITFVISGFFAGIAAMFYIGVYSTANATMANDQLLPAITAVILGGVAANGGRGTVGGVIASVVLLTVLANLLRLVGVSGQTQTIGTGLLLVLAVGGGALVTRRLSNR